MFCHRVTIELKKKDERIHLRPLGDIHIGNPGFAVEHFEKELDFIASHDDYYTIGMGDVIDNVMAWANGTVDKRWQPTSVNRKRLTTEEQIIVFTNYWNKVAHKSFGLFSGNHEWKTITQQRFIKDFCNPVNMRLEYDEKTGVQKLEPILNPKTHKADVLYHQKYLGRLAFINVGFTYKGKKLRDYVILGLHGGYAGMLAGGAVNRLKMIAGDFDCDVVLMGHTHDTWIRTLTKLSYGLKHNDIIEKKIVMANTGTFLRGYMKDMDNYPESNPREAKRVGTITITFDPYKGTMYGHD